VSFLSDVGSIFRFQLMNALDSNMEPTLCKKMIKNEGESISMLALCIFNALTFYSNRDLLKFDFGIFERT
jgi:hypothetical protein